MIRLRFLPPGAALVLIALAVPAYGQSTSQREGGTASGFTYGSQYSFRPLDPNWSFYAMPPEAARYARLSETTIFMTSINYPGVYGAYIMGTTPTSYYDRSPLFTSEAALTSYAALAARERAYGTTPATLRTATVEVRVPAADADLRFNDTPMPLTGMSRYYVTPPLRPGASYYYDMHVAWNDDGWPRVGDKRVYVKAGDHLVVDLTTGEANTGSSLRTSPLPAPASSSLRTRP
jgi:uncharacterized protein (TIGR03000 family)